MTRVGFGFVAGGVVLYLLASQAQIGWLYLIDSMIWGIVVISALLPWWSLKSLRVERQVLVSHPGHGRQEPASPTEDGTVEVRLSVRNRGRLARHFIKVVEDCPLEEPEKRPRVFFIPSLKSRSAVDLSYTATCYRRGRYASAGAVLETAAPMGLFVQRRYYELPLNVTVYPACYEMDAMPAASESWADRGRTVKSSAAFEFYGSREYRYGDSLKHIHWRNTARLGQFVVKEFEETRHGPVAVAFETSQDWGGGKDTTEEYSIKIAASLARYCGNSDRSISILAGPTPLPRAHWLKAMDYLAGLTVGTRLGRASLEELAAPVGPAETLVAIVPSFPGRIIPCLRRLAGGQRRMVVVLLEGFAPGERPHEFASQLSGDTFHLVRCPRGGLKQAIGEISHSWVLRSVLPAS